MNVNSSADGSDLVGGIDLVLPKVKFGVEYDLTAGVISYLSSSGFPILASRSS